MTPSTVFRKRIEGNVMSGVFFTGDTHFNHKFVSEHRRFESLDQMNETLITRWNERISKGDRVYHLGDVALGPKEECRKIIDRLNGRIYLIRGNHENAADSQTCRDRFEWIKDYDGIKIGEQKIYLCHYAFRSWNRMHHGSWNLHGHSHGSLSSIISLKQLDVGVDCWNFAPVSFEEIAATMAKRVFIPVDHHA